MVIVEDDYVYYPEYGIYYGSRSHQYFYQERGAWVSRPEPVGFSANVVLGSPSVRMSFHDSPAAHHAEIERAYPRGGRGRGENRGDRGDRGNGDRGDGR